VSSQSSSSPVSGTRFYNNPIQCSDRAVRMALACGPGLCLRNAPSTSTPATTEPSCPDSQAPYELFPTDLEALAVPVNAWLSP
jgi:hypothetical protein